MASPTPPLAPAHAPVPVPDESELELQHVSFFHRHGDRAPILTQIGSKWKMTPEEIAFWQTKVATLEQIAKLNRIATVVGDDPSMQPHGVPRHRDMAPLAQLTATGVDHMIAKGQVLRAKYDAFITAHGIDKQPQENVFVLSSNVDRTIQSVQCLLYGMFHSDERIQKLELSADNQPVFCVRTQAINRLAPAHPITIFNEIEQIVSHEVEKRDPKDRQQMELLGQQLRELVGIRADHNVPWTAIRDGLTCRKAHAMPFPEGITEEMYEVMCTYDSWLWHELFGQKAFCFSAYEHGVREVYTLLKSVTATTTTTANKPKISFFSAHDNSIVALVSALQLQVGGILPEYGTVVSFEVYSHKPTGRYFVKVLFEGKPVVFAGHEHSALCAFEHFEARATQFLQGL